MITSTASSTAASIFNNFVLAHLVLFFNKAGLFSDFSAGTTEAQLQSKHQFESSRLRVILRFATDMGIISKDHGRYTLTSLGQDLEKNRGFFTWAIGGYSNLLESMDVFLNDPSTDSRPYVNGRYVAVGSDECNQGLMRPIFDRVINDLPASRIADLGCGNAGRLIDLLESHPDMKAIGIDIDPQAIDAATQNRDSHGLQARLELVQENVFTSLSAPRPELQDVELAMSFMMLHDLFNIPELNGQLFSRLKSAFPGAKYFVFADTCIDEQPRDAATMPIFTMGYELVHALRGIQVFPVSYYEEQFARSGLELVDRHDFGVPNTYLFVLKV